ncbi:MAG: TonB family protein, partial [Bacteroidota bacterium]
VNYLSQQNTYLVVEDKLMARLDTIRTLEDYMEIVSLNNAYTQEEYDNLAFLDEDEFGEEEFMEPHNMYIEGSMKSGDDLTFYISGFQDDLTYTLDFGNGIKRKVEDTYEYAYKHRGRFKVRLTIRDSENILEEIEQDIQIFDEKEKAIAEARPPKRPKPSPRKESRKKDRRTDTISSYKNRKVASSQESRPTPRKEMATKEEPQESESAPESVATQKKETDKEVSRSEDVTKPNIELPVSAQQSDAVTRPLAIAEVMPSFPGGDKALRKYLAKNINYPQSAKAKEVEGRVYIQFIVEEDGSLSKLKIMRGIGYGCNEEALRVVKAMPTWKPGQQAGRKVPVIYTLPIRFSLQ